MIRLWLLVLGSVALLCLVVPWWAAVSLLVPFVAYLRHRRATIDRGPRLYPQWMRQAIIQRDGAHCYVCGVLTHPESECQRGGCPDCRQFDHVKAWFRGGSTTVKNGKVACAWCNRRKGAGTLDELRDEVRAEYEAGG